MDISRFFPARRVVLSLNAMVDDVKDFIEFRSRRDVIGVLADPGVIAEVVLIQVTFESNMLNLTL